nr:LPXTG cell wall anchor domain-containing protein [uncultured Caproiciproducens sp.]
MKNKVLKKLNRIALISIAVAALMACSSFTAFAAVSTPEAKVIYTGTTKTVTVQNPVNLNTFADLMPGETTGRQSIVIQNDSSQKMQVYFQANPSEENPNKVISKKLLDGLILTVTFKLDDNTAEQTLYVGPASGKTADKDIVTNPISLGYVYGNSVTGKIFATLTAPEKMDNEFQSANAKIAWNIQFDVQTSSSSGGGGGGGGGGGNANNSIVFESINPESTPQIGPASSEPVPAETIGNEDVPLSNPPKTGESSMYVWVFVIVALTAAVVFIVTKRKMKSETRTK